jgi:DNA topoisomerase-1
LKRIRSLVIPPAWRDVWIAADPDAHLQATGRDARGRKQYRYHPRWSTVREMIKYERLIAFGHALPAIRARVESDLSAPPLSRQAVLATVVSLLDRTSIRVGNEEYARANGSFGLTTLKDRHVRVEGRRIRFRFRAKSGVEQRIDLQDARLAARVKRCQDLPGQTLFQYRDADGTLQAIGSADVNAYLRDIGGDAFTAKDYRTWTGTVCAACALSAGAGTPATSETARKRVIASAIDEVAARLGNTRAVCRKCYVHPAVIDAYASGLTFGTLQRAEIDAQPGALSPDERAALALIERVARVKAKMAAPARASAARRRAVRRATRRPPSRATAAAASN